MESHRRVLENRCRICKSSVAKSHKHRSHRKKRKKVDKKRFAAEFKEYWNVNILEENDDVFPVFICGTCGRFMYRLRDGQSTGSSRQLSEWIAHSDDNCWCVKQGKLKLQGQLSQQHATSNSDSETDSAEETREELGKAFSTTLRSLNQLKEEEATEVAKLFSQRHGFILLSRSDMVNSVRDLSVDDRKIIIEAILTEERESCREDVGGCAESHSIGMK